MRITESYPETGVIISHQELVTNVIKEVIENLQKVIDAKDTDIDVLRIINCQSTLEQLVYDLAFIKN